MTHLDSLNRSLLFKSPPLTDKLALSMPIKEKVLVSPPWTSRKCHDAMEICENVGLAESERCRLMQIFSGPDVYPTFWILHSEQLIK